MQEQRRQWENSPPRCRWGNCSDSAAAAAAAAAEEQIISKLDLVLNIHPGPQSIYDDADADVKQLDDCCKHPQQQHSHFVKSSSLMTFKSLDDDDDKSTRTRISRRDDNKDSMTTKQQRSVSFSPRKNIIRVNRIDQVEEKKLVWFQQDDFERMKAEAVETLRKERSGQLECFEDSTRGLEFRSKENAAFRRNNRSRAYHKVLGEQRSQWIHNQVNPESISRAYEEVSRPCHMAAYFFGLQDEEDAEMLQFHPLKRWNSSPRDHHSDQPVQSPVRKNLRRWNSEVAGSKARNTPPTMMDPLGNVQRLHQSLPNL